MDLYSKLAKGEIFLAAAKKYTDVPRFGVISSLWYFSLQERPHISSRTSSATTLVPRHDLNLKSCNHSIHCITLELSQINKQSPIEIAHC